MTNVKKTDQAADSSRTDTEAVATQETMTDIAVEEIRKRIVLGRLPAGTKLRVDVLATELSMSRVPVREAFRELLAEGLTEIYPWKGAVVTEVRRQDVEEGYRMLEYLEAMAAERCAAAAPEETAARMRPHLERLEALSAEADPERYLEAHRALHFEVFRALGPGLLQRTTRMIWHACERFINISAQGDRRQQAHREHAELVRCYEHGDVVGAVGLTRMHVAHGREAALRGFGFVA
ncbi:GntR family transcriptional regulator [Streptomyces sp. DSM 44917]|uniref:GntR family transcriptional regulator n=1 Tax=Streptomyces boetiae TaxID=3075541 RepID=A0ABU2L4H5_9ACTN|nr:GntR family transcriptional regulator [Streptomyces sp. DSM 44917]MDT0306459.1 GntR family transcriptional regulator [Streptomyces sp. DSM 44917]